MGNTKLTPKDIDAAIALTLFDDDRRGRPVYCLLDEQSLATLAEVLEETPKLTGYFVRKSAAMQVGVTKYAEKPFQRLAEERWFPSTDWSDFPHGLATLATLSRAAEQMHAEGDVAAHNYYSRLHKLLETPDDRRLAVEHGYREYGIQLWHRLNRWLEHWEGSRGVPTAYAIGQMRFVGLPLSQAVIRREDRDRLPEFFGHEGLPPGLQMPSSELEVLLDQWMNRSHPLFTKPLRELWTDASARERICDAVASELEAWDGGGFDDLSDGVGAVRSRSAQLVVRLKTFLKTRVEFDLALPGAATDQDRSFRLLTSDGEADVPFAPGVAGRLQLADRDLISVDSLLGDVLTFVGHERTYERKPRRAVSLRFDDLSATYVETDSVQLGERSLILVTNDLVGKTKEILAVVARDGWKELDSQTAGIPDGWTIFSDVEVYARYEGSIRIELEVLRPRSSVNLSLSGGMSLPGHLRKWSSLAPPEIHVVSTIAESIDVDVHSNQSGVAPIITEHADASSLVRPLRVGELQDGEYTILVRLNGSKKASNRASLRLRSASSPEHSRETNELVYGISESRIWPLSADSLPGSSYVDGAQVIASPDIESVEPTMMIDYEVRTKKQVGVEQRQRIHVNTGAGAADCFRTGQHRISLPDALGGRPPVATISGVCTGCGIVKRYPTSHFRARSRKKVDSQRAKNTVDLSGLPPIVQPLTDVAGITFDALCHVGNGTVDSLSRIIVQQDDSTLGRWNYLQRMMDLGHLDVRRNEYSLEVERWEVSPPTLLHLGEDRYQFVGRRSLPETGVLSLRAVEVGGSAEESEDEGIPRLVLRIPDLDRFLERSTIFPEDLDVSRDTAIRLARVLPPLSELGRNLPELILGETPGLERWDNQSTSWIAADAPTNVGAFRFGQWGRVYIVRSPEDLANGLSRRATPELAKHLAALWESDPLVGYAAKSSSLLVPLGGQLPGLYGRAATLASGQVPRKLGNTPVVCYSNVSNELAEALIGRLTS